MAESEATTQFRELQKTYIETSSKLKQARAAPCHATARVLRPSQPPAASAGTRCGENLQRCVARGRAADARCPRRPWQVAVQGRSRDQERQRCILTLAELEPLPDACNTYKGVGRACVQRHAARGHGRGAAPH
jgi:hypothetical protein